MRIKKAHIHTRTQFLNSQWTSKYDRLCLYDALRRKIAFCNMNLAIHFASTKNMLWGSMFIKNKQLNLTDSD